MDDGGEDGARFMSREAPQDVKGYLQVEKATALRLHALCSIYSSGPLVVATRNPQIFLIVAHQIHILYC